MLRTRRWTNHLAMMLMATALAVVAGPARSQQNPAPPQPEQNQPQQPAQNQPQQPQQNPQAPAPQQPAAAQNPQEPAQNPQQPAAQPAAQPATPAPAQPAQPVQPADDAGGLDVASLTAKKKTLEGNTDLADDLKKTALTMRDAAISNAQTVENLKAEAASRAETIKTAPQSIEEIKAALGKTPEKVAPASEQAEGMKLDQVEQRLREEESKLAQVKSALAEAESTLKNRQEKGATLRSSVEEWKKTLQDVEKQLSADPPADQPMPVTEAKRDQLKTQQALLQQQVANAEAELAGQDILTQLRTQQRDLALRNLKRQEDIVKAWQEVASNRRQQEAAEQRKKAEEERRRAMQLSPAIGAIANDNLNLAKDLEQLTAKEAGLKADLDSTKKQLEELKASYEKAQTRVKELGLSEATGLLLRRERDNLPDVREVRRKAQEREAEINAATEKQLNYEDQRLKLADVDAELDKIVEELDPNLSESMLAWIKNEARGILENKRELLQKLNAGYLRYQKSLGDLEADQQQLVRMSNEYATFIDENVLWIRSMQPVGLDNIKHVPDGFGWLFNPNRWGTFASDLMRAMGRRPVFWLLAAVFTIGLILARPWLRRRLRQVGEGTNKPDTDSIMLTLRALLITIAIALGLPLLMMFVGWRLSGMIDADDFSRAVGSGLIDAGIMLFTLSAFFQVFTPNGLAETHFRWRKPVRNDVRRHMVWLIPLQVSMEFIVGSSDTYASLTLGSDEWVRGSLGLLAFLAAMITLAVFVAIVLRNEGGVMTSIRTNGKDGWLIRLRFAWYWLAVGIPLALGLLACMGYFYTALQLDDRLQQTMWLVMGLIVLNGLILRGYYVELRQLALAEARRKAEELKKQQQEEAAKELTGGESKPDESSQQPKIEEPKEVDIQAIGEQTTALLRTLLAVIALVGLWAIWAEVLPALNLFDNVELWSQTVQIAEGKTEIVPITLTDLLAAILIFGVTMAASKNLPGALEITILNRLPFDAGARYAWSTICQYSIVFAGIALSLSTLGLDMSKLGWLFAALSVGIGFGLQEIVANFICGLILLFERPIRVGDIVEVGGQTGIVSRIRIRATTIVNWDRKEYIVPNKQFITATMLNWTLSNTVNRIVIPIGVAYGSDTDKTREILKRICADHPLIMDDPTTLVTFEGFGDNALNFVVRTYLPDFANRIETIHQLHTTIYKELNEAGITIAFPQRDIHLDTSNPLEIRVIQGETPDGKGD